MKITITNYIEAQMSWKNNNYKKDFNNRSRKKQQNRQKQEKKKFTGRAIEVYNGDVNGAIRIQQTDKKHNGEGGEIQLAFGNQS